jgi:hypothetical protein
MPWEADRYIERDQANEPPAEEQDDTDARRLDAHAYFLAAPPYRIEAEVCGGFSLGMKQYEWWDGMQPEEATTWPQLSRHKDLEEAERRLRHLCSGPHFYDAEGRLVRPPEGAVKPRWNLPPED